MNIRDFSSVEERRKALQSKLQVSLVHSGQYSLDEGVASLRHCENMIGVTQVPLGIAGPLSIKSLKNKKLHEYYIPLSTTEGALVASVNRGCKAITQSGGAMVHSHRAGATRGPVFKVDSLEANWRLYEFLETHVSALQKISTKTSSHLTLKKVSSRGLGRYRYVRFVYDTQDAMGLNMVTIATDAIAQYIEKQTGAWCISLSGNFCVDKKPSWQNFINNRGIKVWAEVVVPHDILKQTLKTKTQTIYETWLAKCLLGSAMSGAMGFNAQYANVIAAIFIATGQDPAHVVEGSIGITTAEIINEHDLLLGIYLPDLMIGTVGGGTGLATQKEALSLLGVAGGNSGNNTIQFAEIIGASVLAGELSLLSSLEEGTLAQAHKRLARGEV